jgi:hypothetical protein
MGLYLPEEPCRLNIDDFTHLLHDVLSRMQERWKPARDESIQIAPDRLQICRCKYDVQLSHAALFACTKRATCED